MSRKVGLGALKQKQQEVKIKRETIGNELSTFETEKLKEKMEFFKQKLEEFAKKHKTDINRDPEFRHHFHKMCLRIGVDPLASHKGFWTEILGVGDFYYELGIQVIDICLRTRIVNGGIIELQELTNRVTKLRSNSQQSITSNDIMEAMDKIKILGSGFGLIQLGKKEYIRSVPCELNNDHHEILMLAQNNDGKISQMDIHEKLGWELSRINHSMILLLQEGIAWIDRIPADNGTTAMVNVFWFPSLLDPLVSSTD